MEEILEFLKQSRTFYLATVEGDQPRVRPFGAVCGFEGKIYFATNNTKECYKQMIANPKTEICGMAGGKWIRLAGNVKLDERREARVAMMEANPSLASMYNVDDNLMVVFYYESGSATISSFTEAPVTIEL